MVIWITGLANAGKTTIGQHVFEIWRQIHPNTVLVDGDDVRRLFGLENGEKLYSVEVLRVCYRFLPNVFSIF